MDVSARTKELYLSMQHKSFFDTDRVFAKFLLAQWGLSLGIAWFVAPYTWSGETASLHPHLWAALILGGFISLFGSAVAHFQAGEKSTRFLIACCQMFMSILIIHITGGRIESHFHVFGSLAFLSFYRDPWVLLTASAITAADHVLRGIYWPMSIYGEAAVGDWRWLEHAAWVVFEDVFLFWSCVTNNEKLFIIAERQADLESINSRIEAEIIARTKELEAQRVRTLEGEKMAALGEMAAGMAHEINNPVAVIQLTSEQLQEVLGDESIDRDLCQEMSGNIHKMAGRIATIVRSLKSFARDGQSDPFVETSLDAIVQDTLVLCNEKFRSRQVPLRYTPIPGHVTISCRSVQISQIVLNLLQNALDAVEPLPERWVEVGWSETPEGFALEITDSGAGIPEAIREKILQPFFTTKEVGKGTGLGLSISKGIMEAHKGELTIDAKSPNTKFVLKFKRVKNVTTAA